MTLPAVADWNRFDEWNEQLAAVMYPFSDEPRPAYLDLEDDKVGHLAENLDLPFDRVIPELTEIVAKTSDIDTSHAFMPHHERLSRWRADTNHQSPPPILPVLSVFSLAAERMSRDAHMSANNYYGRLAELLPSDRKRLERSYQAFAETAWSALNRWLSGMGGARGLPTASVIRHRHIGLSISQALIREADRVRLAGLFEFYDFAPGTETPGSELAVYIDEWIESSSPSPAGANLARLWAAGSDHRAIIAEVASTELAGWDGTSVVPGTSGRRREVIRLALDRSHFPRPRLNLAPLFLVHNADRPRVAKVRTVDGEVPIELEPIGGGAMAIGSGAALDVSDLIEGELVVADPLVGEIRRLPKRLVVFSQVDASGRWIETEQVMLGDSLRALVRREYHDEVVDALATIARPGWTEVTEIGGLPPGWSLLENLEIFARPSAATPLKGELAALTPMTFSRLRATGGFRLPGRIRNRWHRDAAPEVQAVSGSPEPFVVRIFDLGDGSDPDGEALLLDERGNSGTGSLVVALAELDLTDGTYAIEMVVGSDSHQRIEVELRSGDTPDPVQWTEAERIVHDLAEPLAAVGADAAGDGAVTGVQGALLWSGADGSVESSEPPILPWWRSSRSQTQGSAAIHLHRPEPGSCFYTGAHTWKLPRAEYDKRGRALEVRSVVAECTQCGREQLESVNYWRNKRVHEARLRRAAAGAQAARTAPGGRDSVARLSEVEDVAVSARWRVALDALRFAGGGSTVVLDQVAQQIDGSALFRSEFLRTLEGLGHIEVRRRPSDLSAVSWEVCPSILIGRDSESDLVGYWISSLSRSVADAVGAVLAEHGRDNAPPRVTLTPPVNPNEEHPAALRDVTVTMCPGSTIARFLPPISAVVAALPKIETVPTLGIEWFDPSTTSWAPVTHVEGVGAYRTRGYSRRYFLRTSEHVASDTTAFADVFTVKHAASMLLSGRPLLAYDSRSRELIVPLGALLPGLYGRAVVIETQEPPIDRRGFSIYRSVPEDLAHRLAFLLSN